MNESLVKYLAGLLDADGSLSINYRRVKENAGWYVGLQLRLSAADTIDRQGFVRSLPELTDFGSVHSDGAKGQYGVWTVAAKRDLEMLLPRVIKHMVIKAQHWQWLLDLWRDRRGNGAITDADRDVLTQASKESRKLRVGPIRPKNRPTWAWVAGYLDGDGCYSYRSHVHKGYRQWAINVSAVAHITDIAGLELLKKTFGGRIQEHGQSPNVVVWIRSLGYQNRSFALRFLPKVARHARFKRHKIDRMIHHHRQRLSVPGTEPTTCTIDGCSRRSHGRNLCSKHYQREWKKKRSVQATV